MPDTPSRRGRRSGSVTDEEISPSAPRNVAVAVTAVAVSVSIAVAVAVAVAVNVIVVVVVIARDDPPLAPGDAIVVAVAVAVTAIVDDTRRAIARREEEWERH